MKQVTLNHKSGPVTITIEAANDVVSEYVKERIEEIFDGPRPNNYNDLFGGSFEDIFGKAFKK